MSSRSAVLPATERAMVALAVIATVCQSLNPSGCCRSTGRRSSHQSHSGTTQVALRRARFVQAPVVPWLPTLASQ
jgi:hypothetical protein